MDVGLSFLFVLLTLGNFSANAKPKNVKSRLSVLENKLKTIEGRLGLCESKHDMIRENSERLSAIEIHLNDSSIDVGYESREKEFNNDRLTPKAPVYAEADINRILEAFHLEKMLNIRLRKEISDLKEIISGVNKNVTHAEYEISNLKNTIVTQAVDELRASRNATEITKEQCKQSDREILAGMKTYTEFFNSSIVYLTMKLKEVNGSAEMALGTCKKVDNELQIIKARPPSTKEIFNDTSTESGVYLTQQMEKVESIARPPSCKEIFDDNRRESGVYTVYPGKNGTPVSVFCDMETDGGGWTVFQRRKDGSEDFERDWHNYKHGFGMLEGEFWLGNKYISEMTEGCCYELRIDMADFKARRGYAKYGTFQILPEAEKYTLIVGNYSGNAGDSLGSYSGIAFTTKGMDNEVWPTGNCAERFKGGWWYDAVCSDSNLNGRYLDDKTSSNTGIVWYHWKETFYYSLKMTEMKYRKI